MNSVLSNTTFSELLKLDVLGTDLSTLLNNHLIFLFFCLAILYVGVEQLLGGSQHLSFTSFSRPLDPLIHRKISYLDLTPFK